MASDDETPWYRPLLVGVAAMLGVAVLVGGLVGAVALGVVSVSGLGDERVVVEEEPSLNIPDRAPRDEAAEGEDGPTLQDLTGIESESEDDGEESEDGSESAREEGRKERKERRRPAQRSRISLSASPLEVSPMGRIDLTGTYPGGEGATLQVQRFEGGWGSFSGVTATVRGTTFSTYVLTGRDGVNRFRVVDSSSGKSSNAVRIRVG